MHAIWFLKKTNCGLLLLSFQEVVTQYCQSVSLKYVFFLTSNRLILQFVCDGAGGPGEWPMS